MAKFVELTGYFAGFAKSPEKRFVNTYKIRWVYQDKANPHQTILSFDDGSALIVERKEEDIIKLLNG